MLEAPGWDGYDTDQVAFRDGTSSINRAGGSSFMIPVPIFWSQYTATVQGRKLKFVPCENCSTEYVYLIEREAIGSGTSMYMLNNEGAASNATSAAGETLTSIL